MSWRNVDSKGKSECAFQIGMDQQLVSWLKSQSLSLSEDWKIGVPCTATICSQFIGRSEHTCGTEPQYSVYSGMIRTQDLQHFHASGRRSEQLSYLLLRYTSKIRLILQNYQFVQTKIYPFCCWIMWCGMVTFKTFQLQIIRLSSQSKQKCNAGRNTSVSLRRLIALRNNTTTIYQRMCITLL